MAHYGLSQMIVHFLLACHVLVGPLTFYHVLIKFCHVYQVSSWFLTVKRGRRVVFEPVCAYGIKRRPLKLLQSLYSESENIINANEEAEEFVFGCFAGCIH